MEAVQLMERESLEMSTIHSLHLENANTLVTTTKANMAEEDSVLEYDAEIFIDLVKGEPALWNTTSRSYKEQNKRKNAWNKISKAFGGLEGN
jgi:hypothetical protein